MDQTHSCQRGGVKGLDDGGGGVKQKKTHLQHTDNSGDRRRRTGRAAAGGGQRGGAGTVGGRLCWGDGHITEVQVQTVFYWVVPQ